MVALLKSAPSSMYLMNCASGHVRPVAFSPVRSRSVGSPLMVALVRSRQDQSSPITAYGSVHPAKIVGFFRSVERFSGTEKRTVVRFSPLKSVLARLAPLRSIPAIVAPASVLADRFAPASVTVVRSRPARLTPDTLAWPSLHRVSVAGPAALWRMNQIVPQPGR